MGKLDGKVAVLTGATSGIGRGTAERFVEEGATVVIAGRRERGGVALAAKLGSRAMFVRTDVTIEADVAALIASAVQHHGRIDCLFNNAGDPGQVGGIETIDLARSNATLAVHFTGVLLGMKHVAPVMKRQGAGSIINTGSIGGHLGGYSPSVVYAAAKAAVLHLTKCAALELAESGVRVNSISPGAIVTGIFGKVAGLPDDQAERSAAALASRFAKAQPLPRAGQPDDIARAAVFLASDDSSFITGADLLVDGGMIAGRPWSVAQERWKALGELVAKA